jgi:hypothetical protein
MLQEDYAQTSAKLLAQLSQQISDPTFRPISPNSSPFRPTPSAVRINAFWFLSLVFGLGDALFCIFVKEWVRAYMEWTDLLRPQDALAIRQYRFEGIDVWHLSVVLTILPFLLQVALILFFAGLIDFLFGLHSVIAKLVTVFIGICLLASVITTLLPVWYRRCPFKTPISDMLLYIRTHIGRLWSIGTHICFRIALQLAINFPGRAFSNWAASRLHDLRKSLITMSSQRITWKTVDKQKVAEQNCVNAYSAEMRAVYQLFERNADLTIRLKLLSCLRTQDTAEYSIVTSLPVLAAALGIRVESISTLSTDVIRRRSRDTPSELLDKLKAMLFSTAKHDLTAIFDAVNKRGSGDKERQHFEVSLNVIRIILILRADETTSQTTLEADKTLEARKTTLKAENETSDAAQFISTLVSLNEPKDRDLEMSYVGCLGSLDQFIHSDLAWTAAGTYCRRS